MSELHEDDFLDNEPEVIEEVEIVEEAAEAEAEETPETEPQAEETEEVVAEESEVETTATEKEPWTLSAVLDEREKRQKWEKRARELEERLQAQESPESDISIFENEQGAKDQLRQEFQTELQTTLLKTQRAYAVRELGAELVEAAEKWYSETGMQSPYVWEEVHNSDLKFHRAAELFKEDIARQDPVAHKEKIISDYLAGLEEKPKKSSIPSLASKRSAGATSTTDDSDDFLKD